MRRVLDWLDDRTGYRGLAGHALREPVLGGASMAYVLGSVLTFLLLLQMVTGVFLAMYYSPSATDAWGSVAYIQDQVTLGWFVRGMHSHGASAMVIVAGLHLFQVALYGAYKKPRELNWIVGVLLLGLILAFALTGYLLPWDQTGYWATKVATGIAGTSPVIGQQMQSAVQGGNEYGNLTLTRFFAIHVFILPALTILLVVVHLALFRKHGVTPRWGRSREDLERTVQPFWPDQMFRDMVGMALAFAAIAAVNISSRGVGLDLPADPASNFDARPEWYFRPLFQALKYFSGPMEQVVALGLPVVVGGFLVALPFLDRGADRSPRARAGWLALLGAGAVAGGILTALSFAEDRADPQLQASMAESERWAERARALARENGVPAAGGIAVFTTQPWYEAKVLYREHCASCHNGDERHGWLQKAGLGWFAELIPHEEREGPLLTAGYNSRDWIARFLRDPSGHEFFGVTDIDDMDPVELQGADFDAIVEFVYAETGAADADAARAARGKTLFDEGDCSDCHWRDGESSGDGPNLGGRGTVEMLEAFIADAGLPRFFGEANEMPVFAGELEPAEIRLLAEYLVFMRDAGPEDVALDIEPQ